jgi:hypothetical protein
LVKGIAVQPGRKADMRRVAVLMRNGREVQQACQDEDAARAWMQANWRAGDEWVCIENEDLNMLRLGIRENQGKPFLTAADFVLLREMGIRL